MGAALVGPAVPFGFDPGLRGGDEFEFAQLPDDFEMIVDHSFSSPAPDAHFSDFGSSPLDSYSPAASEWPRSPGKQIAHGSIAGASSSFSPGTASLILTPTSSSNTLDLFGDATLIDEAQALDNISTSPYSSFTRLSDDYVDLGSVPGNPRGRRNMNSQPQSGSRSRAAPSSTHPSMFTNTPSTCTPGQWSSFVSTTATGGSMDPSGGPWSHLGLSTFTFNLDQGDTSQSYGADTLSDISSSTGATPRGFDFNTQVRPADNNGQSFLRNPYGPIYSFPPQALQQQHRANAQVLQEHQHAVTGAPTMGAAQPRQQHFDFPPALPSQHPPTALQSSGYNAPRVSDPQSARTSISPSPVFVSGQASRPARHAPYPQTILRQHWVAQQPQGQSHLAVPPSAAVVAVNRQLQPLVARPSRPTAASSSLADRTHRGGRTKNMRLADGVREASAIMRRTGACWRCALQRDPCPDKGTPCHRCLIRSQKGQQYYFACDRSKLPDFVHDFLPPSMTGMHQKQSIEDYVADKVARWDKTNAIDIWLTCGYGPALRWKLYEFEPKDDEPCWQLQYLQDPNTRQQVPQRKYSPPFGLMKIETSDEEHFDRYMEGLLDPNHLDDFGWTCFEEETQVDDFQARLLQAMCDLAMQTQDDELRDHLRKILRMMAITYIMGHTLTMLEGTVYGVLDAVKMSAKPTTKMPTQHVSPRLANRQLKFFFHILRKKVYFELLNWQQQTLRSSPKKEDTWLPAFCVTLGIAMMLEEVQRTLWIQADAKARKDAANVTREQAETEALNACQRIDERYALLVALFQAKYRDRRWGMGSFGNQTPELRDPQSRAFLMELLMLLHEKREHLESRRHIPLASENQCYYTSRLVARFLLPFLGLPA